MAKHFTSIRTSSIIYKAVFWVMSFVYKDAIKEAEMVICSFISTSSLLIKHNIAINNLLPTHINSDNDSVHQILNMLLHLDKASRSKYIDSLLLSIKSIHDSNLDKVLKNWLIFNMLLNLFQYEHFHSQDNARVGLSMRNVIKWYLIISGDFTTILNFFSMPIEFHNVTTETTEGDISKAFHVEYENHQKEFAHLLLTEAYQLLNTVVIKMFSEGVNAGQSPGWLPRFYWYDKYIYLSDQQILIFFFAPSHVVFRVFMYF
ncbi:hypothetical protein V8B97DRAFT_1915046 [Scleroderma yunnanense]